MVIFAKIMIQVVFVILNIGIAAYQAYRFDTQQKRINHTLWAIGYGVLVGVTWPLHHNWYLIAEISILHLPLFNTALNFLRMPRRALFYTHPEDPKGSIIDRFFGESYPAVFFASIIAYIVIQFYLYA